MFECAIKNTGDLWGFFVTIIPICLKNAYINESVVGFGFDWFPLVILWNSFAGL